LFFRTDFFKLNQKFFVSDGADMKTTMTKPFIGTSVQNELAIPAEILEAAQQLAGKLGLSSNELFATALSDFIRRYGEVDITAELDKVYADTNSVLDPVLGAMQLKLLPQEKW
jgi:hypothetical protein